MSNQETQFADPEWQPSRQRRSPREQAPFTPVDVNVLPRQQTDGQTDARDEDEETGDTDSPGDYRALQPGYQYTAQRPHRNRSPWFWVILVAITIAILSFTPFGYGILVFWEVVVAVAISAGITALITLIIRLSRREQDTEKSARF